MKAEHIWPHSRTARAARVVPVASPVQSEPTTESITSRVRSLEPAKIEGVWQFRLWNWPIDGLLKTDEPGFITLLRSVDAVTVTIENIGRQKWKVIDVKRAS